MPLESPDRAKVWGPPPLYALAALLVGWLIHTFVYELAFEPRWVGWILVGLLVVAIPVTFRPFKATGQDPNPTAPSNVLVETGPYRFSRNPMYLAAMIGQGGISMLLGTWWGVITVVLSFFMYRQLAVLPEEAYLEAKLGDPYLQYKESVRRWV